MNDPGGTVNSPVGTAHDPPGAGTGPGTASGAPYDPLRLCVYATVALLAWLLGPYAVLGFAALGFAGYLRARRRGLTTSKCALRDTRLVLAYLGLVGLVAAAAIAWHWLK